MTYEECKADLLAYCQNQGIDGRFGEKPGSGRTRGSTMIYFDLTVDGVTYDTGYFSGTESHNLRKIIEMRERIIVFYTKLKNGVKGKTTADPDPVIAAKVAAANAEAKIAIAARHTDIVILGTDAADVPITV